jgi:hypothetical protein
VLHPLSPTSIFIYSSRGKWPFPALQWSFPPTATLQAFLLQGCWGEGSCHSCLLCPACLFMVPWGIAPHHLFITQGALPSFLHFFVVFVVVVYSVCIFSLFFPGWGSVCSGGYADLAQGCLWEYCMLLSSPGRLHLPKWSGSWRLAVREPSWFLCLMWNGDAMWGLGMWRSQSCASSRWFFL